MMIELESKFSVIKVYELQCVFYMLKPPLKWKVDYQSINSCKIRYSLADKTYTYR
jgi:hypothetical protein